MSSRRGLAPLRSRFVLFAALLIFAILVNLYQFRDIDRYTSDRFAALDRNPSHDVLALGYQQVTAFHQLYGLQLAVAEVAPGSKIIIPANSPYIADDGTFVQKLMALGAVAEINQTASTSVDLTARPTTDGADAGIVFDPAPFIAVRGERGNKGSPWAIALAPHPDRPQIADPATFMEQLMLQDKRGSYPGRSGEFLVVAWQDDPALAQFPKYSSTLLLIETSLLPDAVLEELTK